MTQGTGQDSSGQGTIAGRSNEVVDLDATIPAIPPLPKAMTLWEVLHNRKHSPAAVYVGMLGLSPDPALTEWIAARASASGHADAFQLLRKEWQRRVANRGELMAQASPLLRELTSDEKRQLVATVKRVVEQAGIVTLESTYFYTHVRAVFDALPLALPADPVRSAQDVDVLLAHVAYQADCPKISDERLQAARTKAAAELQVQPVKLRPAVTDDIALFDQLLARLGQRQEAERRGILRACVLVAAELEGASWSRDEQNDNRLPALSPPTAELLHALHAALRQPLRSRPAGWPRRA
jgi:hypothetical protein